MFQCTKCNSMFASKQSLQRHKVKKIPCVESTSAEKNLECKYCHRLFRFASNRSKHHKVCLMKPTDIVDNNNVDEEMNDLIHLIKDLKLTKQEAINRLAGANITNITNHNTAIFQINNFGSESLDDGRITDDLLHKCFNDKKNGIQMLAKHIHFNDDFPNDKNIRRGSVTNKTLQIMQNGSWTLANKNTVLDKVIRDKLRIIIDYYVKHHSEIDPGISELFDKWFTQVLDKKGEDFYNVRNELFLLASMA